MPVLEDAMGGRWDARMLDIWSRDALHVAGASEDDWALETEIACQAIRRGYQGDALHQLVEQIMRAGPYRAKWDEPRGSVTWLAQDVANAVATVQKRLEKYPAGPTIDLDDEAPADETEAQTIARLLAELGHARRWLPSSRRSSAPNDPSGRRRPRRCGASATCWRSRRSSSRPRPRS
jgi:hypothetical protein